MGDALVHEKTLNPGVVICSNRTIEGRIKAYNQLKALVVVDVYDRLSRSETNEVFEWRIWHGQNYEIGIR